MKTSRLLKHLGSAAAAVALCALALPAGAQYSNAVLGLNPILYYHLNDTTPVPGSKWTNAGTAGLAGTMFGLNSPYFQLQPGPLMAEPNEYAAGFVPSSSTYAAIPYSPAMDPSKGNPQAPFTVEGWFNVGGNSAIGSAVSFGNGNVPNGWSLYQYPNSTGWQWQLYTGNGANYLALALSSGTECTPGVWEHVVLVWDGANASMYTNGMLAAGPTPAPLFSPTAASGFAGVAILAHSFNYLWSGEIAELAVYSNALSASNILAHFQNGTNSAPAQTYESLVTALNPLLYYRFGDPAYTSPTPGVEPGPFQAGQPLAENLGSLGTNYDATYEAGTETGLPGAPCLGFGSNNYAVEFDGLDEMKGDFPTVAIPALTNLTSVSNLTFTCWFYDNLVQQSDGPLLMQRVSDGSLSTGVAFSTTGLDLYTVWNANDFRVNFGEPPPQGAWSFLASVWTPTNVTLYLNGAAKSITDTNHTAHDFSVNPLFLGADSVYNLAFNGAMQEAAIFTNALSAALVQSLYAAAAPLPQVRSVTQSPPGPINYEGQAITFNVTALSGFPMTYQWLFNTLPLTNQTGSNLVFADVHATNSGSYSVVVSNAYGAATSSVVTLDVVAGPPVIDQQPTPAAATRYVTGEVTFTVLAVGTIPLTYQWQYDNVPIYGATNTSLTLTGLQTSNSGSYNVVVINPHGTNICSNAVLTVTLPSAAYPSAILSLGPAAYWRLNETAGTDANDVIGGNDGAIVGGVALGQAGPAGSSFAGLESSNTSFQFDGVSGVVNTPLLINGDEGTFAALVNLTTPSFVPGIMQARGGVGSSCGFDLYTDGETILYTWANLPDTWGYGPTDNKTGLAVTPGTWCWVVVAVGQSQTIIYEDNGGGLLAETNDVVSAGVTNTGPLLIGEDTDYPTFGGGIDEAVYFNRALTPAEVAALDQALFAGVAFGAPVVSVPPAPQSVFPGAAVSFSVSVMGAVPLSYQWQVNGGNIPGATGSTLVIPSVVSSNAGLYRVVVSNSINSAISQMAQLTVLAPPVLGIPGNVTYGLVGHYKFDGDFTDSSGLGHNGIPHGSPTFTNGFIGSGAVQVYDNQSTIYNCVALGDPADFQFNAGDSFSVSLWLNYTGTPGDLPIIGNSLNSTGDYGWVLADSKYDDGGGDITCSIIGTGGLNAYAVAVNPAGPMNDGKWHHLVFVNDEVNEVWNAYMDGVLAKTVTAPGLGSLNNGAQVVVGSDPSLLYPNANAPGGYSIDDLGIWRRALTPAEVAGIYAAGTSGRSFDTYGPVQLSVKLNGTNQLQISWQEGTLYSAPTLTGPWASVTNATAPAYMVAPTNSQQFYRVQ